METDRRMDRYETTNLAALFETIDHIWQRCIGQAIAVIGEKNLLILDETTDGNQPLSNISPDSSIHERDAPIRWLFAKYLDLLSEIRDDTIAIRCPLVVQEIVLDDVCLVPEAKNEILMPVLAVV